MPKPYIRQPYERVRCGITEVGESCTDRSFGNDTDVNHIVARFSRTGELPPGNGPGAFADVTPLQGELTEMIGKARDAQRELERLKAEADQVKAEQAQADAAELEMLRAERAAQQQENPST